MLAGEELEEALGRAVPSAATVGAADLFRWVESHRIRVAYAHDPYFAGIPLRDPRSPAPD